MTRAKDRTKTGSCGGSALVICSGSIYCYEYYGRYIKQADVIICADGGVSHAIEMGILPDLVIGDFDSISPETAEKLTASNTECVRHPVHKDKTDSELVLDYVIKAGYKNITLIGATGTRLDHTISNVFLLRQMLRKGINCRIVDENNEICMMDSINSKINLEGDPGWNVSLIPVTRTVKGINTKGLYYPLKDGELKFGSTLGVSNHFTEKYAEIEISKGLLLVIKSRD